MRETQRDQIWPPVAFVPSWPARVGTWLVVFTLLLMQYYFKVQLSDLIFPPLFTVPSLQVSPPHSLQRHVPLSSTIVKEAYVMIALPPQAETPC
jgi:hypothetical protein